MRQNLHVFAIIFVSFLITLPASAQSSAGGGTIQGSVKDSTGAAIPSAKVAVRHIDTGRVTNTITNGDGYFITPPIPIGKYKVRVAAPGMKTWEEDVQLETGRSIEVLPQMVPGQVTETIQVTSSVPLVTTTDPTDATTLDSQRIRELPINGRDLNTLLADVTPGVEQVIDVNGGLRSGGLMVYSTSFTQDGAASNNREFGGSMNLQGLESIGEVRVETSTSSAKFTTPVNVTVSTKSGGNMFHFGGHETTRNNAFGVARARQDISFTSVPYQVPKLIRNEFGGFISGPVLLPKYNGGNKTFFLYSREQVELRQGLTRDYSVPTAAMRNGDFSQLSDSTDRFLQLYDPNTTRTAFANNRTITTRDPFVNNQIPLSRMSPLAKAIWGITPLPSDITNPVITTNLKMAVPTNGNPNLSDNPTTIKVDHRFTERDNFFIKVNGGRRKANFLGTGSGTGAPTTNKEANVTFLPMQAIAGALSWTHMFSPRLNVESLANHTWQSTKTITGAPDAQQDWSKALGLPNPYGEIGFPNINGIGNFITYTEGDNRRALTSRILNLQQNFTFTASGKHDFQFGWSFYSEKQHLLPDQGAISGSANFSSLATALESSTLGNTTSPGVVPQTGYDAANFYLGVANTYSVGLKRSYLRLINKNAGLYLQDNFKVTKRLSLYPGVRWDINPAMREENYQLNGFDLASHSLLLPKPLDYYYKLGSTTPEIVGIYQNVGVTFKSAEELGKSPDIFPSNYFDIGPRLGFAYRAFDGPKTLVIRGGYGMYISALPMRTLLAAFSSQLPFRGTFTYNPNSAAQSPDGNSNYQLRTIPTIIAGKNSRDIPAILTSVGRGQGVTGLDPNFPNLKIHEWNLMLEKQIKKANVFRIRYNGKHGVNADQQFNINGLPTTYIRYLTTLAPLPTGTFGNVAGRPYDQNAYTNVTFITKTGQITTNTFTLETERRFNKGISYQLFYTLTNSVRLAGNSFRDGGGVVASQYLPGSVPTDPQELNRFLNYARDTAIPKHRVRWNFLYQMPFGRGKQFLNTTNKFVNGAVGGWQLSGIGTVVSTWFALSTANWGEFSSPIKVYGTQYPIVDCRATAANATSANAERCYSGYLYYNGYISQKQINSKNAAGLRNGVFGLPSDYVPFQKPINPWPVGGSASDPGSNLYDTNNVNIRLNTGAVVQVAFNNGLHPMRNQYRLGPMNWNQDASMQKTFGLTERMKLRTTIDVFNVFNTQGLNGPTTDGSGIASLENSFGGFGFKPRQVQLGMRLDW